jgi:glycosyltransferase involved in cell wall biosynthesis
MTSRQAVVSPPGEGDLLLPAARRAHVLIVVENNSVPYDRRVWMESVALVQSGIDVTVICPAVDGQPLRERLEGVEVHRFPPPPDTATAAGFVKSYAVSWLRVARLTMRVWRQQPFQVLQACNPPDTYFLLALLLKPLGVKFLFDQHDLCPEVYANRFERTSPVMLMVLRLLERLTHLAADEVITVNESCRTLLLGRTSTKPAHLSVVRTGADLDRLHDVGVQEPLRRGARYLCCYLGVMGPQDGVEMVLRTAHELVVRRGRRDIGFALLGFGELLEDLQRLSAELGLDDAVMFTGKADDAMISAYFSTADVALQPDIKTSFNDCCSMLKTIEYMAFGLPVVAFDLTETRRTVGEAGSHVLSETPEAYADAVVALLDDEQARAAMSRAGRARSRGELAWEPQKKTYVEVVSSVCARASRRAAIRTGARHD